MKTKRAKPQGEKCIQQENLKHFNLERNAFKINVFIFFYSGFTRKRLWNIPEIYLQVHHLYVWWHRYLQLWRVLFSTLLRKLFFCRECVHDNIEIKIDKEIVTSFGYKYSLQGFSYLWTWTRSEVTHKVWLTIV